MIDPKASLWSWLAFDLWFYRTQRGLSLAQCGLVANVARGTVSNWEAGRLRPRPDCLAALDKAWNTGGHFERLYFYAITGHDPDWFRQFVQYEEAATDIKIYHGKTIPTLLQTPQYAQAVLWSAGRTREIEAESKARMKRQAILKREEPPRLWVLLDQDVLDCPVGDGQVMHKQMEHLLAMAKDPRFSIRVVARSAGVHPGHDGPFQIYRVRDRSVAYAGAQICGRLIEGGDEALTLGVRFEQIGALALSRDASLDLIGQTLRRHL